MHYIAIKYGQREGRSKVRHVRDSLRALQIIVEAILRCNPVKMFLLLATPFAVLALWCGIAAVLWKSAVWFLCAVVAASAAALVLGLGFLAVAVMPQRRVFDDVPGSQSRSDTNNSTKAGDRPPDSPRGDGTVIRDGDTPDAV
ncbi:MAG: hypothetical protein R3C19_25845 [Planctomycetaceae bacterium]